MNIRTVSRAVSVAAATALLGCQSPVTTGPVAPSMYWMVTDFTASQQYRVELNNSTTIASTHQFWLTLEVDGTGGIQDVTLNGEVQNLQCGYMRVVGHNKLGVPVLQSTNAGTVVNKQLKPQSTTSAVAGTTHTILFYSFTYQPGSDIETTLCQPQYSAQGGPYQGQAFSGKLVLRASATAPGSPGPTSTGTLVVNLR